MLFSSLILLPPCVTPLVLIELLLPEANGLRRDLNQLILLMQHSKVQSEGRGGRGEGRGERERGEGEGGRGEGEGGGRGEYTLTSERASSRVRTVGGASLLKSSFITVRTLVKCLRE